MPNYATHSETSDGSLYFVLQATKDGLEQMHQTLASVDLDTVSLPQTDLDIANRTRTNRLPWKGQFSPQLAERLLSAYAPVGSCVLDPFAGSGTSLLEAARLGLPASGTELNPAAVVLAKLYSLANLDVASRVAATDELQVRLYKILRPFFPRLFDESPCCPMDQTELEGLLVGLWREAIGPTKNLAAALVVLCDFHRHLDVRRIQAAWLRLRETVLALPESIVPVTVHHADARSLPHDTNSVDLVLTSPPYINVHNYHQQYRRSVEALAYDVLSVARSEIGSNRQNRGNRFLTVIQYSLDMSLAMREVARVTRPGSLSIVVIGRESMVCGVRFYNGQLLAELAVRAIGLTLERRQERVFRNRYGKPIYEDILHLRSTGDVPEQRSALAAARRIASELLSASRHSVDDTASRKIEDALARMPAVCPSPILGSQRPLE